MSPWAWIVCLIFGMSLTKADSYIDAYQSRQKDPKKILGKREYNENPYPVYPGPPAGAPQQNYGPPAPQYGAPAPSYGAPAPSYGPPTPSYGPPAPAYGPPVPTYGPPAPQYGAPYPPSVPFYGMPHAMLGILDKIKFKIDLFTIGKIILKLVIFKKIVSLIAILCLLLFIPSLKHKDKDSTNEDERFMRNLESPGDKSLDNVSQYVMEAIANFSKTKKKQKNCDSVYCKTSKVLDKVNKKLSYKRLSKLYSKEL